MFPSVSRQAVVLTDTSRHIILSLRARDDVRDPQLTITFLPDRTRPSDSQFIPVPGGEVLLTSAALSMVMSTYQHEPGMLSGLVRTIVYQFVGRD